MRPCRKARAGALEEQNAARKMGSASGNVAESLALVAMSFEHRADEGRGGEFGDLDTKTMTPSRSDAASAKSRALRIVYPRRCAMDLHAQPCKSSAACMLIDAVLTPAEIALLPNADLADATCVVFDVLRATSSMLTALAHGAQEIIPVRTIEEARAARETHLDALLGGERHGERIDGFDLGNSPFEYREHSGRRIISTTTNGTIALRACERAARVLVGAILNLSALAEELRRAQPARLVLVCAGTFTTFALEDAWAAGRLIQLLGESAALTDSAQAVLAIVRAEPDPLAALRRARNGHALTANNRADEIIWCAQESHLAVVGEMRDGRITRID